MAKDENPVIAIVDTSVWIDFFCARSARQVQALEYLIKNDGIICITGIILSETLQGIRHDKEYWKTREYFESLLYFPTTQSAFIRAAEIYRSLRRKGITIRKPLDCMIAAVALEYDIPLLHNDRDFLPIEKHCGLKSL